MSRYKVVDNIRIKLTAEEEVARDKEEENAAKAEKELKDADTAKANAKTSGKAKLKAGEALTDAEIEALFGA
jgi:hypothetical protein|tara:strand:- start:223 stop:438 length:216 start_codon:yes stop_codon:yes gene_type:complete